MWYWKAVILQLCFLSGNMSIFRFSIFFDDIRRVFNRKLTFFVNIGFFTPRRDCSSHCFVSFAKYYLYFLIIRITKLIKFTHMIY